mmetsp:Transcript_15462/g.27321  ORF Transcript_15462/g.27321 Transcript_15462/m.27321 type:complete len:238 (+) Transcript_15462:71-784(+)
MDADLSTQTLPAYAINEAAKVMAMAFSDSPAYNFIFQGDPTYRLGALEWFFEKNLRLIQRRCPSALKGVLDIEGKVIACFLWTPSSHVKVSTWDMIITAGLWQLPFKFGLATLKRLLQTVGHIESGERDFFSASFSEGNSSDFIMLERMAIRPDFQGRGLGTKCLKSMIIKTEDPIPIRLLTQEHRNVAFYKRLGFGVVGEMEMMSHNDRNDHGFTTLFTSWFMIREPPVGLPSDDS